ncbi:hypothetical protein D6D19_08965, partial [Aureobasidium pullulans]
LGVVVLTLTVYSVHNHGLGPGKDSESAILFFGWRFSPTLVATIYGLLIAALLNDVRRTEVFARLSRLGGASASTTLCYPARSWWNDPFDALNKKVNNGVYSWALFFTSLAYILVLLIVAPLSAGLLAPANVQVRKHTTFERAQLADDFVWQLDSWDLTTFRTISGAILNKSTSAWLSDFAVIPFWPSDLPNAPLGSSFGDFPLQQWSAETSVYATELDCVPMELTQVYNTTTVIVNYDFPEADGSFYNFTTNGTAFDLDSHEGCRITITGATYGTNDWVKHGGGWFAAHADINSLLNDDGHTNATVECQGRSLIFAKSPGVTLESTRVQAHLCSRAMYFADVRVNVTINQSLTLVDLDMAEYHNKRRTWDLTGYSHNLSTFEQAFLSPDWITKFPHHASALDNELGDDMPWFEGPLLAIAADYANNATELVITADLKYEFSRLYQQFFGEMLLLALQSQWTQAPAPGSVAMFEKRISVSAGIGLTLSSLFFLLTCFVALVMYHTRLSRRPLNLYQDPGGIAAAASLMRDERTKMDFQGTDHISKEALGTKLRSHTFSMEHGNLLLIDGSKSEIPPSDRRKDPRPVLLRGWMGPVLLLALCALVAALIVLYQMSRAKTGIRQSVFVYQLNLDVLGATTTMAPYAIVPTLCAVGIKLWFGAIGDIFKRLQPYITMARAPTKLPNSVMAEYANTPTPFVSVKAIQHSHWLLFVIGIGALATEAFTVGMSALWELEVRNLNHTFSLPRRLVIRDTPILYPWSRDGRMAGPYFSQPQDVILPTVYDKAVQTWLYGAVVELSQSASTPAWTKDTWSFIPLDMLDLQNNVAPFNALNTWFPGQTRNVSFQTTAVRARLDCEPLQYSNDQSVWLQKLDFGDRGWNSSNRPPGLTHGYTLTGSANVFGNSNFSCCANETDGVVGDAAVGYWSNYDQARRMYEMHMSARWIVGRPLNGTFQPTNLDYPLWIWSEEPRLLATNCTPLIEQAEAEITAEVETGSVLTYVIKTEPKNLTMAWSDNYLEHNSSADFTGETYHYTISEENVTVSWGNFFWDTLLNSGRSFDILSNPQGMSEPDASRYRSFNFQVRGLNLDFMSYAMLALANNSKEALLDPQTFMNLANTTFGTFFKHYASENVTRLSGGHTYEPVGEKLPWAIGPVLNETNRTTHSTYQGAFATENQTAPISPTIVATYSIPVQQLVMSPIAVYLCLSILALLVLTTIIMYSSNRSHFKALPRDVDTLASTLAFVHGSDRLLDWAQDSAVTKPWYKLRSRQDVQAREQSKRLMAQMGPFKDQDGNEAWGIELVKPKGMAQHHDRQETESQV